MRRLPVSVIAALGVAICAFPIARPAAQQAETVIVPFSDPGRPGVVKVTMLNGGITVKGTNRTDVLITRRGGSSGDEPPPAREGRGDRQRSTEGLRRLPQNRGMVITEENNQIAISRGTFSDHDDSTFEIEVPLRVNLKLSTLHGDISVENVDGDIEVTSLDEDVDLTNVAGSVVANSHNGDVKVVLTRVTADKAMAFTSFNGDVDVTLPSTAKANVKLRSDNGDVLTDFDVQLRTPSGAGAGTGSGSGAGTGSGPGSPRLRGPLKIEINQAIYGTINGGGPEFELRTFNGDVFVRKSSR